MKKSNQNKKTKSEVNNVDVGLKYELTFKVAIFPDESTIGERCDVITNHIVKALEVASETVPDMELTQSMGYNTEYVKLPLIKVMSQNG